jgi:hypothetical protein
MEEAEVAAVAEAEIVTVVTTEAVGEAVQWHGLVFLLTRYQQP